MDLAANLLGYDTGVYPQLFGEKIDKTGALGQLEAIARDIKPVIIYTTSITSLNAIKTGSWPVNALKKAGSWRRNPGGLIT